MKNKQTQSIQTCVCPKEKGHTDEARETNYWNDLWRMWHTKRNLKHGSFQQDKHATKNGSSLWQVDHKTHSKNLNIHSFPAYTWVNFTTITNKTWTSLYQAPRWKMCMHTRLKHKHTYPCIAKKWVMLTKYAPPKCRTFLL